MKLFHSIGRKSTGFCASLALVAGMVGAVALPAAPAVAGPVNNDIWAASGSGSTTLISDGSTADPSFSYYDCAVAGVAQGSPCNAGGVSGSWTFQTNETAQDSSTAYVMYNWDGLHAWFNVTAGLTAFVDDATTGTRSTTLVNAGPASCCTTPSNGFNYTGGYAFTGLEPGDTYGFTLTGSNGDYNSFLEGTFSLAPESGPPLPAGLTATYANSQIGLSWTEPADQQTGFATGYNVFVGTSPGSEVADTYVSVPSDPNVSTGGPSADHYRGA